MPIWRSIKFCGIGVKPRLSTGQKFLILSPNIFIIALVILLMKIRREDKLKVFHKTEQYSCINNSLSKSVQCHLTLQRNQFLNSQFRRDESIKVFGQVFRSSLPTLELLYKITQD